MRDMHSTIAVRPVLAPLAAAITNDTAQVGAIIDRQGFNSLTYVIATGTLADAGATFTVTMDHGNDPALSDAAAVTASDLVGTLAATSFAETADGVCRKLGYIGNKRYSRLTITPAGNASAAPNGRCGRAGQPCGTRPSHNSNGHGVPPRMPRAAPDGPTGLDPRNSRRAQPHTGLVCFLFPKSGRWWW